MLKVKKLDADAILPTRADAGSNGYDFYSLEDKVIYGGRVLVLRTGIAVKLPEGYAGLACPRSGLAAKHGLTILNGPGLIDNSYTGEIYAILHNVSSEKYHIKKGDKVVQLLIVPSLLCEVVEVDNLGQTERGEKGLGSSGR